MYKKARIARAGVLLAGLGLCLSGLARTIAEPVDGSTPATDKTRTRPRLDLAFCIDTTGSMSGEIEAVKAKTKEIVARLAGAKPAPIVRVGLVAYRDQGDEYVTKVYPFSQDIDGVVKDISSLTADGGGDGPEAVADGLHAAVNELGWTTDKKAVKLLFLIGDAEPHNRSKYDCLSESRAAIAHGIQINTIACNGLSSAGEHTFKQIAKLSDGISEQLTYRQEIVTRDGTAETIVSSAGKTYRVRGAGDDWKEGAEALATRAKAVVVPTMGAGAPGYPYASLTPSSGLALKGTLSRSRAGGGFVSAASPGYGFADESARGEPASRGDSNLADIVIRSTESALKRKITSGE